MATHATWEDLEDVERYFSRRKMKIGAVFVAVVFVLLGVWEKGNSLPLQDDEADSPFNDYEGGVEETGRVLKKVSEYVYYWTIYFHIFRFQIHTYYIGLRW